MILPSCNRSTSSIIRLSPLRLQLTRFPRPSSILIQRPARSFQTTRYVRRDEHRTQPTLQQTAGQKPLSQEGTVKLESVEKSKPAVVPAGQDPLLAEQTLSNKEQRKADWAIIKEMSKYLWPKVKMLPDGSSAGRQRIL